MIGQARRSELEARVYSRAGADDPREEHFDPISGRRVWVTDGEWELFQDGRAAAALRQRNEDHAPDPAMPAPPGDGGGEVADPPIPRRRSGPRRVSASVVVLAGMLAGAALVAASTWVGDLSHRSPDVQVAITPTPAPDSNGWHAPLGAAFDAFRDPGRSSGSLPGWLTDLFPASRVAQLVGPTAPVRGAGVYAVVSSSAIACLVVRLDAAGMVWNCTSLEHVAADGMTLRMPIPAGLATGRDDDGDGIAGDAVHSDLLVVEWHADGTFLITRTAG